jgi:hypothetical protein
LALISAPWQRQCLLYLSIFFITVICILKVQMWKVGKEVIDSVISNLPSDKSPIPDGFNTNFVKRCWPIIKHDICNLCKGFHTSTICLQSLNGFHIHFTPKDWWTNKSITLQTYIFVEHSPQDNHEVSSQHVTKCNYVSHP